MGTQPYRPRMRHARRQQNGAAQRRRARVVVAYLAIAAVVIVMATFGITWVVAQAGREVALAGQLRALGILPDEDGEASASELSTSESAAGELAWRDEDFALDPVFDGWNFSTNGRKTVYLTIDDGPSQNTEAVLDILDAHDAKATFFVVGHNDEYFPMIAEAYRRGHTIGLHSMTHDYAEVYASTDAFFADLDAIGEVVRGQIGYVPCFTRFPGGSSNLVSADYTPGIMTELVDEIQERGYQYYDWNLSTGDGADHTAEELIGYTCQPLDDENIMLLCHDSAMKQTTVEALPAIIEYFQERGYSFEAIDRASWVCHHGVNN